MPIYEYQCGECGHRLEVLQKISDSPLLYCPVCNEASLKKLVSAAAFRLKGTGWYETDFKNNDKKKEASSSSSNNSSNGATAGKDKPKSSDGDKSSKGGSESSGNKSGTSASAA